MTNENGTIVLSKAVLINGKEVKEMTYDTDEIDGALYAQAEAHKMKASRSKSGNMAGAVELDYSLHLYIGFAAVIAINPDYTFEDMERIKGKSLRAFFEDWPQFFSRIGRIRSRQLRRAIRDYSRTYHNSTAELEKRPVVDFIVEYAEAAEDLAAEQKRRQKNKSSRVVKHKKCRRR